MREDKDKSAKPAVFELHGFIKEKIARLSGFQDTAMPAIRAESAWGFLKLIAQHRWLKIQIAVSDLRTFLIGSRTDEDLCGRRYFYLIDKVSDHEAIEPDHTIGKQSWEHHYVKWLDELVKLSVERDIAYFEMLNHRTGKTQYSWNKDDMSEEKPEWWFDGTKAKRQLRKINAKQD